MGAPSTAQRVEQLYQQTGGFFPLKPAFVARDWIPAGRRLVLPDGLDYDVEGRGAFSERWLASTTNADNAQGPADEGLSYLHVDGDPLSLRDALAATPATFLGTQYAAHHDGFGRLAKVFDYGSRFPMHIHPPADQAALVGRTSKDEAYYFLTGVPEGAHPEAFMGLHPFVATPEGRTHLLDKLVAWNDDSILGLSTAYQQIAGEGFFVPSGMLHAAGTALTFELQEASDTLAMFQAVIDGHAISKELLFKDVPEEDRAELGERALLRWVDWQANTDPDLYATYHLTPRARQAGDGWTAEWILYGSAKFTGTLLRVDPHTRITWTDCGVYTAFAWAGSGRLGTFDLAGGRPGHDEVVVAHDVAVTPHEIVNTGDSTLELILYYGPDIHTTAPLSLPTPTPGPQPQG